jgi:hypothetical protein
MLQHLWGCSQLLIILILKWLKLNRFFLLNYFIFLQFIILRDLIYILDHLYWYFYYTVYILDFNWLNWHLHYFLNILNLIVV